MKKILFLLVAAVCSFAACNPTHEDIGNAGHISIDELIAKTTVTVDKTADGTKNGNVVYCQTSAPVNAKWNIGGKEFIGNYAWKKMKVNWNQNGDYVKTPYTIVLTALCPDGTQLKAEFPIECDDVTNPLTKYYIYGDPSKPEEAPFKPGAWDAAAMRFSSTEGAHLPTISDDIYYGLKTLIFDVSDVTADFDLKVMNGWWSNTYYDHVKWTSGLNELQITETMAKECAKGGEGRDLDLMFYSGSMTLNAVYYEE
jgi:predicted small secreted protein